MLSLRIDRGRIAPASTGRGLCLQAAMLIFALASSAAAQGTIVPQQAPKIDSGDTAWMLTSTALVLMMTLPGLFLFYGGLVRSKNVLSVCMQSIFCAAIVSVVWVTVGYSLAFGATQHGLIGDLSMLGLSGAAGSVNSAAPTIPASLFVMFQATFAIITPALITGSIAERMRFPAFALFTLLWSLLIYVPLAHWVWGGGWISTKVGAVDFAGGMVVHISSGVSALVASLYLGKRAGYPRRVPQPHNIPMTLVGAGLLWVGWFGFNAGSAGSAGELASVAMLNTNTAAAAAALAWMMMETRRSRGCRPSLVGIASGAVAGLVAITPAAGYVTPISALVIGLVGGAVCYGAVSLKPRLGYDDSLDVVGVHMVGGTIGALLTGVLASRAINPAIPVTSLTLFDGLFTGQTALLLRQAGGVAATFLFCGVGTLVLLSLVNVVTPVRASSSEEQAGLDETQHGEKAYHSRDTEPGVPAPSSDFITPDLAMAFGAGK